MNHSVTNKTVKVSYQNSNRYRIGNLDSSVESPEFLLLLLAIISNYYDFKKPLTVEIWKPKMYTYIPVKIVHTY